MANPFVHDNYPVVYLIRCLANEKVYIGSTQTRTDRFRTHRNKFKAGNGVNQEIQADWDFYGPEEFDFVVLNWYREGISDEELEKIEAKYCLEYDTFNPEKGYNTVDPITKKRVRNVIQRNAKSLFVLSSVDNTICYNFDSLSECAKFFGFNSKYIQRAISYWPNKDKNKVNFSKSYKGYIFVHSEIYDPQFDYANFQKPKLPRPKKEKKPKPIKIPKERPKNIPYTAKQVLLRNIETGEELIFRSIQDACRTMGLVRTKVRKCVDNEFGKYHTHGFHIKYIKTEMSGQSFSIYSQKLSSI